MTNNNYSNYSNPNELIRDTSLSRERKLALLSRWKIDEEALQRATSEGLNGGYKSQLRSVQKAIDTLSADTDSDALTDSVEQANLSSLKQQVVGIFGTNSG